MKKQKRAFTLLEIMIVICLIGLISGVVGYSMKGSLNKGKAFKTEQAANKLQDIIELELAKGDQKKEHWKEDPVAFLKKTGLVRKPSDLLKDGWGNPFEVEIDAKGNVTVTSDALKEIRAEQDEE